MESAEEFISRKEEQFKKNLKVRTKGINRKSNYFWKREAWTLMIQSNSKNKVFIIERLRKESYEGVLDRVQWGKDDIEYRIGYYIVGKIGKANNKWVWGQFCPLIPQEDFDKLINKARKEGTVKAN